MSTLSLALRNLLHRPLTSGLSVLLAALGAGLVSLLLLLSWQLEQQFERNLAGINLVVGAKGSPLQLILSSMYHVDAPTGNIPLTSAAPFLNPRHPYIERAVPLSLGDSYRGRRIVGTRPNFFALYGAEIAEGRQWEEVMDVLAGAAAARSLGLSIGDEFRSSHGLIEDDLLTHEDAPPFRVVGILSPTGSVADELLLTPAESLWAVHDSHDHEDHEGHDHAPGEHHTAAYDITQPLTAYEDESITSLLLTFKGTSIAGLNMQRGINENTEMQAATPSIEINRVYDSMGKGEAVLRRLAYVIVGVSVLSIFIGLYSSLDRRRGELALMRSLGARPGKLFSLLLIEGVLLAVVGALIGLAISHLGLALIARYFSEAYRQDFAAGVWLNEEWYLILGAVIVGALAAAIPALRAARTDVHRTLSR